MAKKIIKVIYTPKVLSTEELEVKLKNFHTYSFILDIDKYPIENIQIGDLMFSPNYSTPLQLIYISSKDVIQGEILTVNNIPIKELKVDTVIRDNISFSNLEDKYKLDNKVSNNISNKKVMSSKKSMFSGFMEKYKSQFIPKKDYTLRVSMDGNICIHTKDGFVGITNDNSLVSYPEEMTIELPVYIINKPYNKVVVGDIIKNNGTYSKVLNINKNGSLHCLNYSGTTNNSKEIKDFILGSAFVEVVINMFAGMGNNEMNPMMMAMMSEDVDMKDIMMIQMMQGNSNMGNMNPMMLMALSEDGEKNSMVEMMMMSQMMGGTNPFMGMNTNKEEK